MGSVPDDERFCICVVTPTRMAQKYELEVSNSWSVKKVKERLVKDCGVVWPPKTQVLIFEGFILNDYRELSDYNIKDQSTLCLTIDLRDDRRAHTSAYRGSRGGRPRSRTPHLSPPRPAPTLPAGFLGDAMQTLNEVQTLMTSIIGDAVADAPAAGGGRRPDCVVMMDGVVIAGQVTDVRELMGPIIGRQ